MPGKSKTFIDKNKSVTFRLVHRSQKDPFIADPEAGDRVFAPLSSSSTQNDRHHPFSDDRSVVSQPSAKRKEEQAKYGVYFDDDYDYLQHLRDVNEVITLERVEERSRIRNNVATNSRSEESDEKTEKVPGLRLPASLFECQDAELKVGLLNQAAPAPGPHPEMDPDIVAILDDDEGQMDFDELEDDFVSKANARGPGDDDSEDEEDEDEAREEKIRDDERMGSDFGDDERGWNEEETRSRFTEYSMSSSVIPRAEGLQQLDARFEKIFEQYDDSEVGSLDGEEDGSDASDEEIGLIDLNSQRMLEMADEFAVEQKQKRVTLDQLGKFTDDHSRHYEENDDEEPVEHVRVTEDQDRFDCETIVSTYSNLYNHPTLIKEEKKVRLDKKTGLPMDALRGAGGLTKSKLNQLPNDEKIGTASMRSVASIARPKEETPEEKRLRKQTVKLERKDRRCEKKANQIAFKDEEIRRKTVDLNLRQNLQGMKLA